ncbi:MAG TPA: type II toxin-antitoxin system VapC family toxin [Candidatus Acidoferrales bacterium]|nr:type II toxin-antitoxin system VapC family toxin [Candidatus Acidoferrales bacterium]
MTFLLDTHVLLWWFDDDNKLPRSHRRVIRRADAEHPLWVSDISLWEIATLHSLRRIHLRLPLRDWLDRATAPPLVMRHGISPAVAAEVASLPSAFHRDPADRIIVATARVLGATLLTRDTRLIDTAIVPTWS